MKILTIYGTRPECIKLAPVIKEIEAHEVLESIVCFTGQHQETVTQLNHFFGISVSVDLNLMVPNQDPLDFLSRALPKLDRVLKVHQPDWILVQGDTTSVLAAALAAFHEKIKIGHVEAGLRSFDKWNPFPEEMNRKLTTCVADLHFAPTETAKRNLLLESCHEKKIFVTGNTVIDALKIVQARLDEIPLPKSVDLNPAKKTILVTLHRRESFGRPMNDLFAGLIRFANVFHDTVQLVYPIHPNPKVKNVALEAFSNISNVILIEPLPYFELVKVMNQSYFVVTDSGGIQEEAPSLGKPVLVCRNVTERPEGVAAGVAKLVGTDGDRLFETASKLMNSQAAYDAMAKAVNPYGDGRASCRIIEAIMSYEFGGEFEYRR